MWKGQSGGRDAWGRCRGPGAHLCQEGGLPPVSSAPRSCASAPPFVLTPLPRPQAPRHCARQLSLGNRVRSQLAGLATASGTPPASAPGFLAAQTRTAVSAAQAGVAGARGPASSLPQLSLLCPYRWQCPNCSSRTRWPGTVLQGCLAPAAPLRCPRSATEHLEGGSLAFPFRSENSRRFLSIWS